MTYVLKFSSLCLAYQNSLIFKDLDCQISENSMMAVVGPNGSGKSTLFKSIIGDIKPVQGNLWMAFKKHQVAYLSQHSTIDPTFPLTVFDAAAMGLYAQYGFYRTIPGVAYRKVEQALRLVGLENQANNTLEALSGGQSQRLFFARMALQDAKLILLDEPFAAIDQHTADDLVKVLKAWHAQGKTILCILHDVEMVKLYFPETLLLARGRLAQGQTKKVLTDENLESAYKKARRWES